MPRLPTEPLHNAHNSHQTILVKYPYHPRHGQCLEVVGHRSYHNQTYLVVNIPSSGQEHIPKWMTEEPASRMTMTSSPALSLRSLLDLSLYLKQVMILLPDQINTSKENQNGKKGSCIKAD